jgi:3'(2'), 5'-bisphosphate nucleotidase
MSDLNSIGKILADIVEAASAEIMPLWRGTFETSRKADNSPVTEADQRAEAVILARLAEAFPGVPVIAEEDAAAFGAPSAIGPRFFLVDPLDGTKAFVRGDEHFTVNIGLVEHGVPVAGAVAAPVQGRTWFTTPDGAVRRPFGGQSEPVHVRPWPPGDALALISHTMKSEALEALKAEYGFAHSQAMDSSIKLCIIAEGGADLYARHGPTMEWDIAAGHAVLSAAGGSVRQPDGSPFLYGKADQGFRNGWFVARGG